MPDQPALLPCAHCGGRPQSGVFRYLYFAHCIDCGMSTNNWTKRADAVFAWNRRAAIVPDPDDLNLIATLADIILNARSRPDPNMIAPWDIVAAQRVLTALRDLK